MKLTKFRALLITVIVIVILVLSVWTATSPPILERQTQSSLSESVFSYAKSVTNQEFIDGSGSYIFTCGFDYSDNLSVGATTRFAVYCALTGENISSAFTRGVALQMQSSSLLIDGKQDPGITTVSKIESGLQTYDLQNPNLNISPGLHNITARLILSTIDVNYIGNFQGNTEVISLNGEINLTAD